LVEALASAESLTGKMFKRAIVDRGYRGQTKVGETLIVIPNPKKDQKLSAYQKLRKRAQCTSRAAIEPIISHVKSLQNGKKLLESRNWRQSKHNITACSIQF
jgi:transposase, IS5 family